MTCACGCGAGVFPGRSFRKGHHRRKNLLMRLLSRIEVQPSGCWKWLGMRSKAGHAQIKVGDRSRGAYAVFYEFLRGPIPRDERRGRLMDLDHVVCDGGKEGCANPFHCEPSTRTENLRRAGNMAAVNAAKKTCPRGHPYDKIGRRGQRICSACPRERYRERRSA